MDVSIILCTHERAGQLPVVLGDLLQLDAPVGCEWEIVVVDNNSSDETSRVVNDLANEHPGRIRSLFEGRQGKSFALNLGVRQTDAEVLLFTDDDVRVDRGWMKAILQRFQSQPACLGIGGRLLPVLPEATDFELDEDTIRRYHSFDFGNESTVLENGPFGGNMAYRREAFVKYGLFRTDLGPTEFDRGGLSEDSEFARRLLDSGELICYEPKAVVHHGVPAERLTVEYLDRWHFQYGRALWRREGHPAREASRFSIPPYLLRSFVGKWFQWIVAFSPRKRRDLRWKMELLQGQIYEARHGRHWHETEEGESYEDSRNRT